MTGAKQGIFWKLIESLEKCWTGFAVEEKFGLWNG